jgi:addiction module HigA family antidote
MNNPAPIVTPGDVLRESVLERCGITQDAFAAALGVSRITINQIVNDRRSITAAMALRLARATSTSPQFWLNLQQTVDLNQARQRIGKQIAAIRPLVP